MRTLLRNDCTQATAVAVCAQAIMDAIICIAADTKERRTTMCAWVAMTTSQLLQNLLGSIVHQHTRQADLPFSIPANDPALVVSIYPARATSCARSSTHVLQEAAPWQSGLRDAAGWGLQQTQQ